MPITAVEDSPMLRFISNNRKILLLIGVLILSSLLFLGVSKPARADTGILTDLVSGDMGSAMGHVLDYISSLIQSLIKFMVNIMKYLLEFDYVPTTVKAAWQVLRDFVNLFFILSLIVMAGATVFDVSGYRFKDLFAKFLIAALLINFSFVIGQYVFQLSNGLTAIFLNQMQAAAGGKTSLTDMLGPISGAPKIQIGSDLATGIVVQSASDTILMVITALMKLIFLIGIFLGFAVATIFLLIRIVFVWFLLLVSPLAWLGLLFPTLYASTFKRWWSTVWSWSMALPAYVFFLCFAILMYSKSEAATISAGGNNLTISGMALGDILFYILIIVFLFWGLFSSFMISKFMGGGAGAAFQWAQNRVKNKSGYRSFTEGAKAVGTSFLKEGLPGRYGRMVYGGQQALDRRTARYTQGLQRLAGYRSNEAQTNYNSQAEDLYKNLNEDFTQGKISAKNIIDGVSQYKDASDPRYLAYRKMLAGIGQMDSATMAKARQDLAGNIPAIRNLESSVRAPSDYNKTAEDFFNNLNTDFNQGRIDMAKIISDGAMITDSNDPRYLAYRKMEAQYGSLDVAHLQTALTALNGNPSAARDLAKIASEGGKFRNIPISSLGDIVDVAEDTHVPVTARRELLKFIQSNYGIVGDPAKYDYSRVTNAFTAFGGQNTPEAEEFVKALGKIRPDLQAAYLFAKDPSKSLDQHYEGTVKLMSGSTLGEVSGKIWETPDFQSHLATKLGPSVTAQQRATRTKTKDALTNILANSVDGARKIQILQSL